MTAARFRLGQDLCLEGAPCAHAYVTAGEGHQVGDRCSATLDAAGLHAATCLVGGHRKQTHHTQRDLQPPKTILPNPTSKARGLRIIACFIAFTTERERERERERAELVPASERKAKEAGQGCVLGSSGRRGPGIP